jgi:hypothetical protein
MTQETMPARAVTPPGPVARNGSPPTPQPEPKKPSKPPLSELLGIYLRKQRWARAVALSLAAANFPLAVGVVGLSWFLGIPWVYVKWVEPLVLWHLPFALLGLVALAVLPLTLLVFAAEWLKVVLAAQLDAQEPEVAEALGKAERAGREVEAAAAAQDPDGLLPVINYSQARLEAYYQIGLSQTRRSFWNSVVAMWIGFALFMAGVVLHLVPLGRLGVGPPPSDVNVLVIVGGAVIEFISALFLWVYRSSMSQLTYYYNRQLHIHNMVFCSRIAASMSAEKRDEAKRLIVKKMLDAIKGPEALAAPGGRGMRDVYRSITRPREQPHADEAMGGDGSA